MNYPGGATSLSSFLKADKTSETKRSFPYKYVEYSDKKWNKKLPPNDAFYNELRAHNPLEAEQTDYADLLKSGMTTEQAVVKLNLSEPPPTGVEKYQNLQKMEAAANQLF